MKILVSYALWSILLSSSIGIASPVKLQDEICSQVVSINLQTQSAQNTLVVNEFLAIEGMLPNEQRIGAYKQSILNLHDRLPSIVGQVEVLKALLNPSGSSFKSLGEILIKIAGIRFGGHENPTMRKGKIASSNSLSQLVEVSESNFRVMSEIISSFDAVRTDECKKPNR